MLLEFFKLMYVFDIVLNKFFLSISYVEHWLGIFNFCFFDFFRISDLTSTTSLTTVNYSGTELMWLLWRPSWKAVCVSCLTAAGGWERESTSPPRTASLPDTVSQVFFFYGGTSILIYLLQIHIYMLLYYPPPKKKFL